MEKGDNFEEINNRTEVIRNFFVYVIHYVQTKSVHVSEDVITPDGSMYSNYMFIKSVLCGNKVLNNDCNKFVINSYTANVFFYYKYKPIKSKAEKMYSFVERERMLFRDFRVVLIVKVTHNDEHNEYF